MLDTSHWLYWHGEPQIRGQIKHQQEDFLVQEILGYEPTGEGEHIYLWVRKAGLNTAYVAEQLAKFTGLPLRAVTYAGRKDKHAVTEQWFGIHHPGKADFPWQNLQLPGATILHSKRHNRKLRTGNLQGNRFRIVVRDLTTTEGVEQRLASINELGVPNYFGQQRFGDTRHHPQGGNLALAELLIQGETLRNRNKRSMAISALRSWLFNEFVSQRIAAGQFNKVITGDALQLAGTNSFFVCETADDTIAARYAQGDISPTAPLWGSGALATQGAVQQLEQDIADKHSAVCETLQSLGLKQERRPVRLIPRNMHWKIAGEQLTIEFELPAGCFATAVLREVVKL